MPAAPSVVADRYRLLESLGAGGMGRVWRARDETLHRDVAVKQIVLPPELLDNARDVAMERTLREARAAARLNHPNVVRVYDVLAAEGQPWLVMEYVPSRSLDQVIRNDGLLEPRRVAEIGLAVLDALRAAHRAGVDHRDIKPGNVLLADDGRVVLTDFGIARVEGEGHVTRTGLVLGSPEFIAPERAREGTAGPASDLWSLGATLYTAVEGRSPFGRGSAMETLTALASEEANPPQRAGALAPALRALLRKDPKTRADFAQTEELLRRALVRDDSPKRRRSWLGGWGRGGAEPVTPVLPAQHAPLAKTEPAQRPVTPRPANAKPVADAEPIPAEPVTAEPLADAKPVTDTDKPVRDQLVTDKLVTDKPVTDKLVTGKLVRGEPDTDEPVADAEPVTDEPNAVTDKPLSDEPDAVADELVTDKPVADAEPVGQKAAALPAPPEPEPEPQPELRLEAEAEPEAGSEPVVAVGAERGSVVAPAVPVRKPKAGTAVKAAAPGITTPEQRRRRLVLGGVGTLLVVALLVWLAVHTDGGDDPQAKGTDAAQTTAAAEVPAPTSPSATQTAAPSASPSTSPSASPSVAATGSAQPSSAPPAAGTTERSLPPLPPGWIDYRDPSGFSVYVPAGWRQSKEGGIVYFRTSGRTLGIDQSDSPRPDPVADWRQQEQNRVNRGEFRNYTQVRLEPVGYFIKAADWEFTFDGNSTRQHVNNRGVVATQNKAYGFWWQTPDSDWAAARPDLQLVFDSFRPAR
ncbi:protein kinase [Dactylosporangium sp. NPDC051484]|uniref:serine/threonine-protein kinase n=1 Tax=Dactylosporangium sp. NPDC051484 TaxID=3154942 RepID=UPI003450FC53